MAEDLKGVNISGQYKRSILFLYGKYRTRLWNTSLYGGRYEGAIKILIVCHMTVAIVQANKRADSAGNVTV